MDKRSSLEATGPPCAPQAVSAASLATATVTARKTFDVAQLSSANAALLRRKRWGLNWAAKAGIWFVVLVLLMTRARAPRGRGGGRGDRGGRGGRGGRGRGRGRGDGLTSDRRPARKAAPQPGDYSHLLREMPIGIEKGPRHHTRKYALSARERTAKWHEARDRLAVVRQAHDEAWARGGAAAVAELRSGGMESVDAAFAKERALHAAAPRGEAAAKTHRRKTAHASAAAEVSRLEADAAGSGRCTAARAGRRAAAKALPAARDAAEEAHAALPSVMATAATKRRRAKRKDRVVAAAAVLDVLVAAEPPDRETRDGRREALARSRQLEAAREDVAAAEDAVLSPEQRRRRDATTRIPVLEALLEELRDDNSAAGLVRSLAVQRELANARRDALSDHQRRRADALARAEAARRRRDVAEAGDDEEEKAAARAALAAAEEEAVPRTTRGRRKREDAADARLAVAKARHAAAVEGGDDAALAAASATLAIATAEAVPRQTRVYRERRATAAAADALVRELEARGLGEEDSELLGARAAAAAARGRTQAVCRRRRVERLLAEGMRAKEKYDSLVARGVRGAAAERAFGAMCQTLRKTAKGARRLASLVDAATTHASPRQLESEYRTLLDACKAELRRVFGQTTLPVYVGLAGDAWWEDEVQRVALRSSWRWRLFLEEDEDLEPTDRRPVPLRGTRLASTAHKSIAGRLERALHAWAARHWPDRVLHFAIAAGGSFADVAAHAVYMAVPDAPADVVVHVRSPVVAPEEADEDEEPTRPLTDFSDDVPPPLEATATDDDVDEKLVRGTALGHRRPYVVKTTGCSVVCRWAGSLASFAAGATSSTCDFCETPKEAQALARARVAEKIRGPYERVVSLDGAAAGPASAPVPYPFPPAPTTP
ncbi:unnamed protein product, partial [Pelagomonas calceolata]